MSIQLHPPVAVAPRPRRPTPLRLASAAPALWRVLDPTGRVIGHVQARNSTGGTRYRARRFHVGSRAFRDLGDFWSIDDALDCLRYTR
ncbi:hypothetical protein ACFC3F_05815 [Microbacterium sp. NPDC055910]|uniref:hypothetical protein n=1 Tax=Microbacterium sp. NPDC055910 TaxID=3345659 RepID=UPI0035D892D2